MEECIEKAIELLKKKYERHCSLEKIWNEEIPILTDYMKKQGIERYQILYKEAMKKIEKSNKEEEKTIPISIRAKSSDQAHWKEMMDNNNEGAAECFQKLISCYDNFTEIQKLYEIKKGLKLLREQANIDDNKILKIKNVIENLQDWIISDEKDLYQNTKTNIIIEEFIEVLELFNDIDFNNVYPMFKIQAKYIANKANEYMDIKICTSENNAKFIKSFKESLKMEVERIQEISQKL